LIGNTGPKISSRMTASSSPGSITSVGGSLRASGASVSPAGLISVTRAPLALASATYCATRA
jgi:hypothetical protein